MNEDQQKDYNRARVSAMNMLARREQSRAELLSKLGNRFAADIVQQVVDDLTTEGLQSDERFLQSFVSSRVNRGQGPVKIAYELRHRGVDAAEVEAQLEQYAEQWFDLARELVERKFGELPPADFKERQKRQRFVAGRGFPHEICYKLFD